MLDFIKNFFKKENTPPVTAKVEPEKPKELPPEKVSRGNPNMMQFVDKVPDYKIGCIQPKLLDKQKAHICKMLGEFVKPKEICRIMKEVHNIDITTCAVQNYKTGKRWQKAILESRQAYLSKLEDVPGYHKRVRLERMERAAERCEDKDDIKTLISAVAQQQKEVEGGDEKLSSLTINLQQLNIMSDEELQRELDNTKNYIMKLEKKKTLEIKGETTDGKPV